jgi:hypothetical protein
MNIHAHGPAHDASHAWAFEAPLMVYAELRDANAIPLIDASEQRRQAMSGLRHAMALDPERGAPFVSIHRKVTFTDGRPPAFSGYAHSRLEDALKDAFYWAGIVPISTVLSPDIPITRRLEHDRDLSASTSRIHEPRLEARQREVRSARTNRPREIPRGVDRLGKACHPPWAIHRHLPIMKIPLQPSAFEALDGLDTGASATQPAATHSSLYRVFREGRSNTKITPAPSSSSRGTEVAQYAATSAERVNDT